MSLTPEESLALAEREMDIRDEVIRDWPHRIIDLNEVNKVVWQKLAEERTTL